MAGDRPKQPAYEIYKLNVNFNSGSPDFLDLRKHVQKGSPRTRTLSERGWEKLAIFSQ